MSKLIELVKKNNILEVKKLFNSTILNIDEADALGKTALHYAVENENEDVVKLLLQHCANPNVKDSGESTPLHSAAVQGCLNLVKILSSNGADVNVQNVSGMQPIHNAIRRQNYELVAYLQSVGSKVDIEGFKSRRKLCNIFNNDAVINLVEKYDTVKMKEGGTAFEARATLQELLPDFINSKKLNKKAFKPLLDAINLQPKRSLHIILSGCDDHDFYAILKDKDSLHKSLYIAERGLFSHDLPYSKKISSIWLLEHLNKNTAKKIEDKLIEMSDLNEEEAENILLNEIPRIAHRKYKYMDIAQEGFKHGHCYFENLKTALLSEFIDLFGINNGRILYKELDIFMHEQALINYMQVCSDSNKDEVKKTCDEIIKIKKDKLAALQQPVVTNVVPCVMQSNSPTA